MDPEDMNEAGRRLAEQRRTLDAFLMYIKCFGPDTLSEKSKLDAINMAFRKGIDLTQAASMAEELAAEAALLKSAGVW